MSRAEERILRAIFDPDAWKDQFLPADESHDEFPEWSDLGKSSRPIEIEAIVTALGLSEDPAGQAFIYPLQDPNLTPQFWIIATSTTNDEEGFAVVSCTS